MIQRSVLSILRKASFQAVATSRAFSMAPQASSSSLAQTKLINALEDYRQKK